MTEEQKIIQTQNENTEKILKGIEKLKSDYHELCSLKDMRITDLEEKNEILERRIVRAKECMKKLLFVVESEHLNCKGLIRDAEDFIHNRICPLRKQGQHCITEEPCIMCDRM